MTTSTPIAVPTLLVKQQTEISVAKESDYNHLFQNTDTEKLRSQT